MANLLRLRSLPILVNRVFPTNVTSSTTINRANNNNVFTEFIQRRGVGTSKITKKDDKVIPPDEVMDLPNGPFIEEDPCNPKKTWVWYGFDDTSKYADRHFMHVTYFLSVSLALMGVSFIFAYFPDNSYKDWAQREAYLLLRERESKGLPPIDVNVCDPAKIKLPTDEELGDTDVII